MKQWEIIKKEGVIEVKDGVKFDNKRYFLKENELFLENYINFDNINNKANYSFIRTISIVFDIIKSRDNYSQILATVFNKIKDISSEKDLNDLVSYLTMEYEKTFRLTKTSDDLFIGRRNILNDLLNENKDTLYFLVIKKSLDEYFNNITSIPDLSMLDVLLDLLREDKIDEVLQLLNISFDGFNDEKLKYICYKLVVIYISKNKQVKEKHLCGMNCGNLSPLKCTKIYDIHKKYIKDYDYIKSGYQTFHEDEKGRIILDSFVVTDCDNYYEVEDIVKQRKKYK